MSTASGDLWVFSLKLYAEPGVAASCLSLQNQHGFDVNLVLFCLWYGFRHGVLTEDLLKTALDTADRWRETVVQPLRSLRTRLKRDLVESAYASSPEISALREKIKTAELDAERIQQQELEKLIEQSVKKALLLFGESVLRGEISTNWRLLMVPGSIPQSAAISTTSSS